MKLIINTKIVMMFVIFSNLFSFSEEVAVEQYTMKVKVVNGILYYCRSLPTKGVAYDLHCILPREEIEHYDLRVSFFDWHSDVSMWLEGPPPQRYGFRINNTIIKSFPSSWDICGNSMGIIVPCPNLDALGRICFQVVVANDALNRVQNQIGGGAKDLRREVARLYPYPVMVCPTRTLDILWSAEFSSRKMSEEHEAVWYEMMDGMLIARIPRSRLYDRGIDTWYPCKSPESYRWLEYESPISNSKQFNRIPKMINADRIVPSDKFSPVGAARVAGRRVLSDFAEARFPKDADWLIWEKSPESSRLCKMAKGKWATCPEMPVQKPPQLIVTDDDNGVVHLVYSFGIDPSDVEGSLRKVAKMLEECGCPLKPQPAKTANAPTAGSSGSHETKKQNVAPPSTNAIPVAPAHVHKGTNQVSAAKPPARESEIVRQSTNQVARAKDSEEAAAKAFEAWGIKPEEKAKRGAMLYEKPETREEGLRLLRESAREGSAFALARLSALYYTGDGGVKRDYAMAVKLMEAASAKGFPSFLLPLERARKALKREADLKKKGKPGQWPGMGYPGVLLPYGANGTLQKMLDRYSLTAGVFRRDPIGDAMIRTDARRYLLTEEVPYLLFTPKSGSTPVPLVMYFGGTGEQGKDLAAHFRQRTIFEMVCSPEFQKKRPCYLFAPMVPKDSSMFCSRRYSPPMADLVCDAMYAVIRSAKSPSIDTNRLYLTGLSWGGSVAYTMPLGYAGRFAASVPVAGYTTADCVPDHRPGNFWLLFNEHEYADKGDRARLDEMIRTVTSRGGEFRVSSFPDKGHNSWDKAWREEKVWDWMFSKTADGRSVKTPAVAGGAGNVPKALRGAKCTASKPGRDAKTGPERAVDGLDATCYVSKTPFKSGDWWQMEFAEPVSGRVIVKSGYANGRGRMKSAHVETSTNGRTWARCGGFSRASGECHFPLSSPIRYLRVVSKSSSGETMVIREVEIAE